MFCPPSGAKYPFFYAPAHGLQLINPKKATASNSIPPKLLRKRSEASANVLHILFNALTILVHIIPLFKWKNRLHKVNYRPVSLLPSMPKVFEKLMQKQISGCISSCLSPYLYGYGKSFSSTQALLSFIENWKKILNKKGFGGQY